MVMLKCIGARRLPKLGLHLTLPNTQKIILEELALLHATLSEFEVLCDMFLNPVT